jgi:hypothetical protein
LVTRNHAADARLKDMTEQSSAARNKLLNLPYRLMLPSLARRLVYRSLASNESRLRAVTACEGKALSAL